MSFITNTSGAYQHRTAWPGRGVELAVTGLFVFIGAKPGTGWLAGQLAEDRHGFLLTGSDIPAARLEDKNLAPLFLETAGPAFSPSATCAAALSSV